MPPAIRPAVDFVFVFLVSENVESNRCRRGSYSKKILEYEYRPDSSTLTPRPAVAQERVGLAFRRYLEGLALFVDGIQRGLLAQLLDHGRQ